MNRKKTRRLILAFIVATLVYLNNNFAGINAPMPGKPFQRLVAQAQTSPTSEQTLEDKIQELFNQGKQQLSQGDSQSALEKLNQALALSQQIGRRDYEATILNEIAVAYYNLGQYDAALQTYEQSLVIYRQEGNTSGQGVVLTNMGAVYQHQGLYQEAIDSHEEALAIFQDLHDYQRQGEILNNIGAVYHNLGRYNLALELYEQSLELHRSREDYRWQGATLNNIGLLQERLSQYEAALKSYEQALVLAELENDPIRGRILNNIGSIHGKLGAYKQALDTLDQALELRRSIQDRPGEVTTLARIGDVYQLQEQYETALDYYRQALAITRSTSAPPQEGQLLSDLGVTLFRSGAVAEATTTLEAAIQIWESLRPGLEDDHKVSLADQQAETYQWLQQVLINQGEFERALEISERGRARAFADLIADSLSQAEPYETPDPLTFKQIQQIAQRQQATLVEYSVLPDWLYIWVVQPDGTLEFRQQNISDISCELLGKTDKTRIAETFGRSYRTSLPESTPFPLGRSFLNKLLLNRTASEQRQITNDLSGNRFRGSVTAQKRKYEVLSQKYDLLIKPIEDLLPTDPEKRIIFIPQGRLFLTPFVALQDQQGHYFIESHTVLITPSIQVLDLTQQHQARLENQAVNQMVVVGNPKMPSISSDLQEAPAPLIALPEAEREAQAIAQMLKTQAIIGEKATEELVVQNMPQARVIHLATHGLLHELRHLGLRIPGALALTPTEQNDGLLTAEEILTLKLNAELVVLSACNTGRGAITGDGVIGLSRSFISAGVPSVVVSLWLVPDASTSELMKTFYRQMQQGSDKATALRQAMLSNMEKYHHLEDWAGFMLIGQSS
ncbi:MAG: CHAT domain-containing protein [Microcoleaceae cyanobacterium]